MRTSGGIFLITTTAVLALSACNKPGAGSADGSGSTETAAASTDEGKAKLGAYTEGYNKLLDTFGLPATAESYAKQKVASQQPSDSINVSDGWLEQGVTLLKKAQAMPGGPADVNQAAGTLIGSIDTVLKRLTGLKIYYDSKAYKDDALARGKLEDPLMLAEFKTALAAMDAFSTLLDRERKAATTVELAAMKAKGDMLGYNTKLALQQAASLIEIFKNEEDIRNPATIAKADAQVAVLEKTLTDQRAELAKAKAAVKADERVDVNYGLVADRLTSAVGDYRDMKQSREVDDYNDMIGHYNDAVGDANDIG